MTLVPNSMVIDLSRIFQIQDCNVFMTYKVKVLGYDKIIMIILNL